MKKDDKIEIDLRELFLRIMANIWSVLIASVIGGLLAYLLCTVVITKKYNSTTKIYVLNQQDATQITYSDLQTGTQLTKDYAELVLSRTVTSQVIAQLDLHNKYEDLRNITPDELAKMISVNIQNDTRIISITVTDTSPTRAQDIANAVRVAASSHIYDVMDIEAVNVVDYANLPEKPSSPKTKRNIIIGALLGFILAIGIITVVYILDDTIKTPDDIEKYLGLSVLGSIPYDENEDTSKKKRKNKKSRKKVSSSGISTIKLEKE